MARFETFARDIKVATAGIEPEAISGMLARHARAELAKAIQSGQASPSYEKYVNGRKGVAEESVVAPGPIVYVFTNWPLIIRTALAELQKRVPRKSGRYASGFMVLANGAPARDYSKIPATAEVVIFNVRPYTRKMETGANKSGKRHFSNSRQAILRRWGHILHVELKFLKVGAGLHPSVPYILRTGGPLHAAKQDRRSSAFRAGRKYLSRRADRAAGQPISYPALVINLN